MKLMLQELEPYAGERGAASRKEQWRTMIIDKEAGNRRVSGPEKAPHELRCCLWPMGRL